ncbi:hypothetical protein ACED96_15005 [Clostridium thermobutyricum]
MLLRFSSSKIMVRIKNELELVMMRVDFSKLNRLDNELNSIEKVLNKKKKKRKVEVEYIKKAKNPNKQKKIEKIFKKNRINEDEQIKFDI